MVVNCAFLQLRVLLAVATQARVYPQARARRTRRPRRLSICPQGADFSLRDDLTGQAIDCVALGRRPPAKILQAAHEAQAQDLPPPEDSARSMGGE